MSNPGRFPTRAKGTLVSGGGPGLHHHGGRAAEPVVSPGGGNARGARRPRVASLPHRTGRKMYHHPSLRLHGAAVLLHPSRHDFDIVIAAEVLGDLDPVVEHELRQALSFHADVRSWEHRAFPWRVAILRDDDGREDHDFVAELDARRFFTDARAAEPAGNFAILLRVRGDDLVVVAGGSSQG
jgi:hypothetical protein